jgi:competence protein ComEC
MRLISLSLAWVAGIYIGSLVSLPLYAFLSAFILSLIVALLCHKRPAFLWGGLCLIVLFGGIGCYQWRVSEPTLQSFNDQGVVAIRGEVDRDPEFEGNTSRLRLSAKEIRIDSRWEKVSGKVLIDTTVFPAYSTYSQGDLLQVTGELHSLSQSIDNPDHRAYLSKRGFSSTMSYPQIEFIQTGWLLSLRNRLAESLDSALPEPQSSLAQALLLGIRSHIPDSLIDDFRSSGTAHLIAISGLHVAILGGIVLSSAAWVFGRQRPTYILIVFGIIWVYVLLTGMRPPAFRAAIMFSLFLTALGLGRPRSALPSLVLAAAIMVGISPLVLWDVSFQLSFVAVAGLILFVPPWVATWQRRAMSTLGGKGPVNSTTSLIVYSLAVTLAAIIATYPLIAYYFGYVSLVALPATFLALLALPGAIILALLTALLGLFTPALSWVIGWVDWLFLSYIIKVVEGFGALPFAKYDIAINGIMVWVYYGVIVAILARKRLSMAISKPIAWMQERLGRLLQFTYRVPKRWILIPLLIAAALVWLAVIATPDRQLEVSFLDVGQGDAILIQTPSRQQILIDGGPDPEAISLWLGKKLPFWDKSLDLVVLTHPEDDHLVGLVEVLGRYQVGQVLEPGFEHDIPAYKEWLRLVDEKDIKRTIAKAGQQIELGDGIRIEVLHPQEEFLRGTGSDINNNSVVLRLVWEEVSFLLTGDIYEEAEREILYQGYKLSSTVLKVAHHGSATSTSAHFLAAVDPQVAVISVGGDNLFGHPSDEILARLNGVSVYRTDKKGTITFTTDGQRLWVEVERE